MLAASISRLVKPTAASRSNFGSFELGRVDAELVDAGTASPSVHLLNANLMSNAVGSAFSTVAMASSEKPLAFSVEWLMPGAWPSEPWPTA